MWTFFQFDDDNFPTEIIEAAKVVELENLLKTRLFTQLHSVLSCPRYLIILA